VGVEMDRVAGLNHKMNIISDIAHRNFQSKQKVKEQLEMV
jgi:hypothetical protein